MKILYGLPSEGMGHATRSKVIIEHLLLNHDVQIVTSDRAFTFLSAAFPGRVHQIEGFHLAYKDATVSITKTIIETFRKAPHQLIKNFDKYAKVVKQFNADLVISDFESFTYFYAKAHRKLIISIDNMQIINRTILNIPIPESETFNYLLAKNIIKAKVHGANHYFISTFFKTEIKKKRTSFVPPIIRPEIIAATTTIADHIIVYQTSSSQKDLVAILNGIPNQQFIVYGFNKEEQLGNVILKKFAEAGFIKDLSSAKAVLSNGGYSFISEAVYLKKPIYAVPIKNQFEQFVNASYVQQLGYGMHQANFTVVTIQTFIDHIKDYAKQLNKYKQEGNEALFKILDQWIASSML
jgi:uncharacterized protein (TIGR00661 family)